MGLTALVEPSPSETAPSIGFLILIISILFPIFVFLSTLSSTATLTFLRAATEGQPLSPWNSLKHALSRTRHWFPAGLVLALLTIPCAFSLLLIPVAVYFSAVYSFAPFLALEQPGNPLSLHFSRSKKLVSKALGKMLLLAASLLLLEFALAFFGADLGARVGAFVDNSLGRSALSMTVQLLLALLTSFIFNPLISVLFLKLRSEP